MTSGKMGYTDVDYGYRFAVWYLSSWVTAVHSYSTSSATLCAPTSRELRHVIVTLQLLTWASRFIRTGFRCRETLITIMEKNTMAVVENLQTTTQILRRPRTCFSAACVPTLPPSDWILKSRNALLKKYTEDEQCLWLGVHLYQMNK